MRSKVYTTLVVLMSSIQLPGQIWSDISPGTSNILTTISFVSRDTGFICDYNGNVYSTIDTGNNWSTVSISPIGTGNHIHFVNSQVGFSYYGTALEKSIDGGANWTIKLNAETTIYNISFPTDSIGYAAGIDMFYDSLIIWKTMDQGETWNEVFRLNSYGTDAEFMEFLNQDSGFVCNSIGMVYKTSDGGNSFTLVADLGGGIEGGDFFNFKQGIMTTPQSDIVRTFDGGFSWDTINTGFTGFFYTAQYVNPDTIYLFGGTGLGSGLVVKSADSGVTWTSDHTLTETMHDACLVENVLFTSGSGGKAMRRQVYPGYEGGSSGILPNNYAEIDIFPNPALDQLYLRFNSSAFENLGASVLDIDGRCVLQKINLSNAQSIDISSLNPGIYLLYFYQNNQSISVTRFIKS